MKGHVGPTYNDLIDFLPEFIEAEMDIRVFRQPKLLQTTHCTASIPIQLQNDAITENGVSVFSLGDYPVEKKFPRELPLSNRFFIDEIQKIKKQNEFDKTVKPYPDRDWYYNILINDFKDLQKLFNYWCKHSKTPNLKVNVNVTSNNEKESSIAKWSREYDDFLIVCDCADCNKDMEMENEN